ncbi:MAG: DUF429 domain-containing protein [Dehalococcoidia bacterium]|nr:MAG: DUF429 domain-containing protein [Dehalococcoidia bacterium]
MAGATKKIWLAEATAGGELLRLESGRNRDAIAAHLIEEAQRGEPMIVGLDFAFSFPAWFMDERGYASAPALWDALAAGGVADEWLTRCEPPLWGRPGRRKPAIDEHFRETERCAGLTAGVGCKSVFQIGGAGAVGTGSIRGMPVLHRLREGGFGVWPFDAPARATAVEIYPRLLTGAVKKSGEGCRRAYIAKHHGNLDPTMAEAACSSEDAFDAAVSALVMAGHSDELARLPQRTDARTLIEGEIWRPGMAS